VIPAGISENPDCPVCKSPFEEAMNKYLSAGKKIQKLPDVTGIKKYVSDQLEKIDL
jgi:hypothetical protein